MRSLLLGILIPFSLLAGALYAFLYTGVYGQARGLSPNFSWQRLGKDTEHEKSFNWMLPHQIDFRPIEIRDQPKDSVPGSKQGWEEVCDGSCGRVAPLLEHIFAYGSNATRPGMYVVPLDAIASIRSTKPSQYPAILQDNLNSIYNDYSFLRLNGASHVFLCLTEECTNVMMDVVRMSPIGKRSRAIWIGNEDVRSLSAKWACPDRVLALPTSLEEALGLRISGGHRVDPLALHEGVEDLLSLANSWMTRQALFRCGNLEDWDLELPESQNLNTAVVVDRKHKFLFCGIPKCGVTRLRVLLRRMSYKEDWDVIDYDHVFGYKAKLDVVRNSSEILQYFKDTSWTKAAIIRHPVERFLSGYLNKIVFQKWHTVLDKKQKGEPTIQQVISRLKTIDAAGNMGSINPHFKGLAYFCGFKHVRYDFVGKTPFMNEDVEQLLTSMGLWEEFGASGWGENKNMSFSTAHVYKSRNNAETQIHDLMTEDQIIDLLKLFETDFDVLGLDKDKSWEK